MVKTNTAANTEKELIDVLTAISKVSMRLAVKLEMLDGAAPITGCTDRRTICRGGYPHEAVRSESGYRRTDL